jgi:ribosome-associated protein
MADTESGPAAAASKSRRKRDMTKLQRLGEALLDFDERSLTQLGIPEGLRDAVRAARRMTAHGARRRQLQYIGKLMRSVDSALIEAAIHARRHQQLARSREFHRLEELRDALLAGDDAGIAAVLVQFPRADRQHLRRLARNARREQAAHQPPQAARRLFRYLRELQEQHRNGKLDAPGDDSP